MGHVVMPSGWISMEITNQKEYTSGFEDPPLSLIITPPHQANIYMLLGVWAQWKALCWVVHTPGLQVSKVDITSIIQNNYFQELERAQATGWAKGQ